MRKGFVVLVALAALAVPAEAPASHAKNCGVIYNVKRGRDYRIRAATNLVRCGFARRWSRRYIRHGTHPSGWSCSKPGGNISFYCKRGRKFYYAQRV